MKGFMCQSPAATAVCTPDDLGLVAVPRKANEGRLIDNTRLIDGAKYSKLAKPRSRRISRADGGGSLMALPSRRREEEEKPRPPRPSPPSSDNKAFQVVAMKVSLHCQGCAAKVKKHLSKMEGVTSFSIDLETKRVTVMGHISPKGVLESISKVKRAEIWPR